MMASEGGGEAALHGDGGWGIRKTSQPQLQQFEATTITATTTTSPGEGGRGGYGGSSYGGAGGKSRASRAKSGKKGLPYERPPIGRSAASGPQTAAILSAASTRAFADKAQGAKAWLGSSFSKMISSGATYLYSSIFRPNNAALPAPLPVLDIEAHRSDEDEQSSFPTVDPDHNQGAREQNGLVEGRNHIEPQVANSNNSDLEKLLAKQTLSRDEFQRLTELLQSRVVSNGVEKQQQPKHVEFVIRSNRQDVVPSGGNQSEAQRWREDLQKSRDERENSAYENGGLSSATQAGEPESLDVLNSSPVEVAKAFMGGRGSRLGGTLSMEPLNQLHENHASSGPPLSVNAPQTSLAKWSASDFINEDQFGTPPPPTLHSWGRHRTIPRTPYSRPLRLTPSRERAIHGTFGPRWTPIRTPVTGGREVLKRRSTVLDEGWTSGGPIRRTRHKAIVSASPSNLNQSRGLAFPATPPPSSLLLSLPSPVEGKRSEVTPSSRSASPLATTEKSTLTSSGNFFVPAQSSATARKILETLDKITPPKGKCLGDELAYVRERPPSVLTEGMLNDQARKSMTFVEYVSPSDPREPGPSGRTAESLSSGYPSSSLKMSDSSPKVKEKGKGPLPSTENGPSGTGGLLTAQEKTITADGSVKQPSTVSKEAVSVAGPGNNNGKGFRMSAVFEESGSEDEGRKSMSPPPMSIPKLPTTSSINSVVTPSVLGASKSSTSGSGLLSFPASVPGVDTSKAFSSGFSFHTRASLEGPPTPKGMSPASSSPKANTATPLFQSSQAVEPPAALGSTTEASIAPVKAESHPETKTDFSFGSPSPVAYAAQAVSISQPSLHFPKNIFKQNSPPQALSSALAPPVFPTSASEGGTSISATPTTLRQGDILSAPVSSTPFKVTAIPTNATPFGQLFTSNSSFAQSASVTVTNLFSSNTGSVTAPASSLFASSLKPGTSVPPAFGQSNSLTFRNLSSTSGPLVSPDFKNSVSTENSTPVTDPERPQKRSMLSSSQPDFSNQQQPPSHVFTSFGSTLATSAASPAIPVTIAPGGQNSSASQGLFSVPSFAQASSSASQTASALPSAVATPAFPFSSPATSAGTTSSASSSAAGFGSAPSFPSFPSSVFGTVSSGNTFGLTPAPAPLSFGSIATSPAFGSTSASSVFGGFASEAVSHSPPTPVFGSGFTSPSSSTSSAFSFGASSPAFSFGPSAASGSAFTFGSAGPFPFVANKSSTPSPVFGLSSSLPAFGATTNGTMANDVVVNDQSNMDDNSMAEEPSQIGTLSPQPSMFGAQSNAGAGSFVFGAQAGAPGPTVQPLFGGFSNLTTPAAFGAAPANPFATQPAGSLDFAGGSFTLGSSGDNRSQRKMFKAKRTGAKRGK